MSVFLDTNVLVCAYGEGEHTERALGLLAEPSRSAFRPSTNLRWPHGASSRWIGGQSDRRSSRLSFWPNVTELHDLKQAVRLAERYGFAFFDAVMIATALTADCLTFYSQDLHHGLVIEDRLTILNPFR